MAPVGDDRYKRLDELVLWQDNYNRADATAIARSIRRFGFNNVPRLWRDNIVMAGNHTVMALRLIHDEGPRPTEDQHWPPRNVRVDADGAWRVQWVDVSHLDEVEARGFAIADNELARQSVADDAMLARYLREIAERDPAMLTATGFDERALNKMVAKFLEAVATAEDAGAQTDRGEELRVKWGTERGQLWLIPSQTAPGAHRLLIGDSTSAADVRRLMDGQRAVLFATDPPYLVGYDGTNHPHAFGAEDKNKDWSASYHDWDDPAQGEALYDAFVRVAREEALRPDAAWYCWHASRHQGMLERIWESHGAFVHQQIVWAKDRPVLTRSWYMWQHEPCFFGWQKSKKPPRVTDDYPSTVWQIPTIAPGTSTDHPTSKPVQLFAIPMEQHTRRADVCYEPFAGSGSQFVAGEQLGRLVYGMEIEPVYCAVILQRLTDMGLTPEVQS